MKKVLALLAGAAAVGGAVWYLNKKKKENTMLFSEEFEEIPEDAIVLDEDEPEAVEEEGDAQ